MGDEVKIDKQLFHTRLGNFISTWKDTKKNEAFAGAESIVVVMGKTEEGPYSKSLSLHFWLLGYEFPATLFLITPEKFYVVTTAKKAKHLEALNGGKIPVEFLIRGKDEAENKKQFEQICEIIKKTGKKVGILGKDQAQGPFAKAWKESYNPKELGLEEVDVSAGFSQLMAVKDEAELKTMRASSRALVGITKDYFIDEMSKIIDEEKKVTHEALSRKVEAKIDDEKFFKNKALKLGDDFDTSQLDWTVGPVIQSGGKYDLKQNAQSDDNPLHAGIILASMGLRYKSYSAQIARTYLIDPTKSQEKYYGFLTDLQWRVLTELRDGAVCKDIYNKAIQTIKSKHPELEKHFLKTIGFGIGIEARDGNLLIGPKSTRVLKDGMTLCVTVGFSDLENPKPQDAKSKNYSLLLTDTVRITQGDPLVFTGGCPKDLKEAAFYFKDEEPEVKPKVEKKTIRAAAPKSTSVVVKSKLRGERKEVDDGAEQRRKEHQKELQTQLQIRGKERFSEGGAVGDGKGKRQIKRFESYKRENQLPTSVGDLKIVVDIKNQTIIVPVFGRPVPFHIATIKNASKTEEDDFTYLRINLLSPGQGVGRKDDLPFEDPNAHFLRSLTYRSTDNNRIASICDSITEMKKNATKKEQERKEMEDVVTQDNLREMRNRRPQRLPDVFIRPAMDGKRLPGELEIHENGLRYQSLRQDQRVDVLFSNVKHLFFQPCAHELIVLIHVHLKDPIMIGKKKTKDVQFYREATDIQFDETGNRKRKYRYGDEEEFEQEQEERRRRAELDKEFKAFAEKISEAAKKIEAGVDVDVPYRELGFSGVPYRANVLCSPTTDALVSLTDMPFLVITLDEIEIAHLERIQFGLKNFDLVFVYKEYTRPVTHINSIPMELLENVKEWLDSSNIAYSEGPLNLNWPTIMKTVIQDPKQFFADGGWSFLASETDDEDGDEEEEESEFEASDFGEESDGSDSEESDFSAGDDASADEGSDASDVESGDDWDEMEEEEEKNEKRSKVEEKDAGKKRKR
ncbi:FACT complex subunit-domain-containing protein [Pyronema domesticum]|uniref:FACT complex subunit n=1 Tax=Pyronema omphalodes (strain CBS 100304) TaxID=1076935 RepID=U4KWY1_PYROM|nr:FACT complex subunit-domain-containing protein [Pyronema domesticum]CCX06472.1 Similar to FACT complex subunit spt16; acc. no. Q5B2X8 [Pyronema omphalodes CBS 100304]